MSKTKELTHLEIMDRMTIDDNQGIRMQNKVYDVNFIQEGAIVSMGIERATGDDAFHQHCTGRPGKYMFALFAIDRAELESTRKKIMHERKEDSSERMIDRFEQLHCAQIRNLFWLMCQYENNDLKEMLCEMDALEFDQCFPGVLKNPYTANIQHDSDEILNRLSDCGYNGLLAEVEYPEMCDFTYRTVSEDDSTDETDYKSCSIHGNVTHYGYVYAESKEELLAKMELQSVEMVKYWIAQDKTKK